MSEWDRQPGEPAHWYQRFTAYRLMPKPRSTDEIWRREQRAKGADGRGKASGAWDRMIIKWRWTDRAAAWDLEEARALSASDEAERLEARKHRRALIKAGYNRIAKLFEDPAWADKLSPFARVLALRIVTKELRAEYDEEPKRRHELGGLGGGPIEITLQLTPPRDHLGPEDDGLGDGPLLIDGEPLFTVGESGEAEDDGSPVDSFGVPLREDDDE